MEKEKTQKEKDSNSLLKKQLEEAESKLIKTQEDFKKMITLGNNDNVPFLDSIKSPEENVPTTVTERGSARKTFTSRVNSKMFNSGDGGSRTFTKNKLLSIN